MKHITSMILTLAMLASFTMVSCDKNTQEPANTAGTTTPAVTTEAASTTGETENVVTTFEETTEPTSELPKFDINSDECLLYRLLDMTVDEIEAEFGELKYKYVIAGGAPCYELPGHEILLVYRPYSELWNNDLPKDLYPWWIETYEHESAIYPGIYVGMDSKELIDSYGIDGINYSVVDISFGFSSVYYFNNYEITVFWNMNSDLSNKFDKALFHGEEGEFDSLKIELVEDMRSGKITESVSSIYIEKLS